MNHQGYRTTSNRQWIVPKRPRQLVPVIFYFITYFYIIYVMALRKWTLIVPQASVIYELLLVSFSTRPIPLFVQKTLGESDHFPLTRGNSRRLRGLLAHEIESVCMIRSRKKYHASHLTRPDAHFGLKSRQQTGTRRALMGTLTTTLLQQQESNCY